jgi:hypothetical protein
MRVTHYRVDEWLSEPVATEDRAAADAADD